MLKGFEEYTRPLTENELRHEVRLLAKEMTAHRGEDRAMSNGAIRDWLARNYGLRVSDTKVRAFINAIRTNGWCRHLIASSRGYYVATSVQEVEDYCRSLRGRENAIKAVRLSLQDEIQGQLFI